MERLYSNNPTACIGCWLDDRNGTQPVNS